MSCVRPLLLSWSHLARRCVHFPSTLLRPPGPLKYPALVDPQPALELPLHCLPSLQHFHLPKPLFQPRSPRVTSSGPPPPLGLGTNLACLCSKSALAGVSALSPPQCRLGLSRRPRGPPVPYSLSPPSARPPFPSGPSRSALLRTAWCPGWSPSGGFGWKPGEPRIWP